MLGGQEYLSMDFGSVNGGGLVYIFTYFGRMHMGLGNLLCVLGVLVLIVVIPAFIR